MELEGPAGEAKKSWGDSKLKCNLIFQKTTMATSWRMKGRGTRLVCCWWPRQERVVALPKRAVVVGLGEAGGFGRDSAVRSWKLLTRGGVSRVLGVGRKGVSGLCCWVNGGGHFLMWETQGLGWA